MIFVCLFLIFRLTLGDQGLNGAQTWPGKQIEQALLNYVSSQTWAGLFATIHFDNF